MHHHHDSDAGGRLGRTGPCWHFCPATVKSCFFFIPALTFPPHLPSFFHIHRTGLEQNPASFHTFIVTQTLAARYPRNIPYPLGTVKPNTARLQTTGIETRRNTSKGLGTATTKPKTTLTIPLLVWERQSTSAPECAARGSGFQPHVVTTTRQRDRLSISWSSVSGIASLTTDFILSAPHTLQSPTCGDTSNQPRASAPHLPSYWHI